MSDWNSDLYLKFQKQRTEPSNDFMARLSFLEPKSILDIGSGPGNSTKVLHDTFRNSALTGSDISANMLKKARENYPFINFIEFDASKESYDIGTFDLVFSNACFQWIPNHTSLLPHLMTLVNDEGTLAFQVPEMDDEPIEKIIKSEIKKEKWKDKKFTKTIFHTLTVKEYHDTISSFANEFEIWRTTYFHRLKNQEEIIEWYKSTGLKPYLEKLSKEEEKTFLDSILDEVKKSYPLQKNGEVLFKIPRLFVTIKKTQS